MAFRKALFPLLLVFALLTSQISAAYIVFCLLALAWAAEAFRRGRPPESLVAPIAALFALHALFILLSAVFSRDPAASARHLPGLILFLAVPIAMDLVDRPSRARAIFLALGASGTVLSLDGLWQFFHGGDDLNNRIRATLSHYMTFSGLVMLAACLLLGFLLEEKRGRRWAGLVCLVPFAAMLLSFTRNAYVGTLAAVAVYLGVRRPKGLLLAAPLVAAVFWLAPADIKARIVSIGDLNDPTNRDRIAMARAGARMIADYPLFGVGQEMVKPYYTLYRDPDAPRWRVPHLHDNALQLAAAHGVFAAAAYLAIVALFLVRTVRLLRRERRRERAALLAGALLAGVAISVAGLFEYNFGDTEVLMATLLVFAVPFSGAFAADRGRRTEDRGRGTED